MRAGEASETARRVAAHRLTFDRVPVAYGDPARDKRERLARLGIDVGAITFVPADFGVDEVGALMVGAGYQTQVPSLLLCEGVAIYLERGVLESLLRHLRQIACSGSRLAISLSV